MVLEFGYKEDRGVHVCLILKFISENRGRYGLDSCASGYGPVTSSCEHCDEISCSVKTESFLNSSATIKFSARALLQGASLIRVLLYCRPKDRLQKHYSDGYKLERQKKNMSLHLMTISSVSLGAEC